MVARKSSFQFLNPGHQNLISDAVPLDGVFPLLPPVFEPLSGEPALSDGEPPTALGRAVMEWYGRVHGRAPEETPAGLVRAIEAVSIGRDNADAVRRAQWRRNHAGLLSVAQLQVCVPMVRPATVQPRMAASAQRIMREKYQRSLIHEVGTGLRVQARSAQHLIDITEAQKTVRIPHAYAGEAEKEFADSLALEGIREEVRGFAYDMFVSDDERGHLVETDDGWTRVSVAQSFMGQLMGLNAELSTLHWENGDGSLTVRPHTPDTIEAAFRELRFEDASFAVWPAGRTGNAVQTWLDGASPEAEATVRMMTARMDIGIAVRPYRSNSDHDVVYADMARFHVKGQNPTLWGKADDEAFKARTVVNDLVRRDYLTEEQRDVFFGDTEVPWADDPARAPYRSRVVATTHVMVSTVVDDPALATRYGVVRETLKRLRVPNSPLQAATTTASLAGLVAGLEGDGEMGQFTAVIARSFRKPELRDIGQHEGNWTELIERDVEVIAAGARRELDAASSAQRAPLGAHQRALAVLALVAHAANPALREYRMTVGTNTDGSPRTVRYPSSMTLTGRGGRGGVMKVEADVVVLNAARSREGIDQLEAIVAAASVEEPVVPLDPAGGEEMLEEWLRQRWANTSGTDGRPERAADGFTGPSALLPGPRTDGADRGPALTTGVAVPLWPDTPVEEEPDTANPLSDPGEWSKAIIALVDDVDTLAAHASVLAQIPVDAVRAGVEEEEYDPEDPDLPRMIDEFGIDPEVEGSTDESIENLRRFLRQGVMAYLKQQARR
ncbi:hypothetical protein [Streptomyces resistomycificus]|uniref:Uncharacterized protein n=1 Tax=Streptomyces resistomycificus TaxID=67356 RepID=A0A0L8L071_9ACTN|nr:hypothetical protein [Streptomyces resistomycificus]KOG31582.1 hypothetical protein ADK37_30335 [Streptomyces resistomycificus]KUO00618.1 hypothetical protein AQJ84_06330 [Streptomyces resistomycificus]